jgi:hypothetical protein
LIYKGKEYKMPDYTYVRKAYKSDIEDRKIFSLAKSHVSGATKAKHCYRTVYFFPNRHYRGLVDNSAFVNYRVGMESILFFENPGLKKGEKAITQIQR